MMAQRNTAVIKAAKTFLQTLIKQNISTNVYQTVLFSRQTAQETTARMLSKTAYPVTARVLRSKCG